MSLSDPAAGVVTLTLDRLPKGRAGHVVAISGDLTADPVCRRLYELGFEEGARIECTHTGPMGGDPIAVKIGVMTVALRRAEAAHVIVCA